MSASLIDSIELDLFCMVVKFDVDDVLVVSRGDRVVNVRDVFDVDVISELDERVRESCRGKLALFVL